MLRFAGEGARAPSIESHLQKYFSAGQIDSLIDPGLKQNLFYNCFS